MRILNHHLVFKTDEPSIIALPGVKSADGYVAVPHTLQMTQVLCQMGIKAPSPIRSEYKWQGKYNPFIHQVETSEFLTLNKRCFCLSGMGTGKTLSALWAADYLISQGIVHRVLIVSPLSTLDVVWGREIFTNFPHRSHAVLHGSAEKRRQLLSDPRDFYIINHDGVAVVLEELKKRTDINLIILDELGCFRNAQTKKWRVLKTLMTPDRWVWGMTGSPTPQAPTDAYAQAKLIRPENVPYSFTTFKSNTMHQVGPFKWIPRRNAEETVARVLTPSIRFALRDCIDLPETIVQYRAVELTPEQKKHYQKLLKECVTEVRGTEINAVNAAVLLSKLIQCSLGVMYGADREIVKIDCQPRVNEVLDIIEECNEKVIVFVPLTGALHHVKSEIQKRGYSCAVVEGDTSKHERVKAFDALQHGDLKVLVANPATMAHGISLTAATTIVYFAPCFSAEVAEQSAARIVRPGQTKTTNIVNIFATKEEEKIYSGLKEKKKFLDTVLEIVKNNA